LYFDIKSLIAPYREIKKKRDVVINISCDIFFQNLVKSKEGSSIQEISLKNGGYKTNIFLVGPNTNS